MTSAGNSLRRHLDVNNCERHARSGGRDAAELHAAGIKLAVVTNDQEAVAKAQFARLGWDALFCKIIGADSGYGGKPDPGGVRAAIESAGVVASDAIMVGDSEGDLVAGKRAGCAFTIAIHPDSTPLPAGLAGAACRMPHIGPIPDVLETVSGRRPQGSMATPGGRQSCPTPTAAQLRAAAAASEAAAAAAAAVDPDVIAMVDGL